MLSAIPRAMQFWALSDKEVLVSVAVYHCIQDCSTAPRHASLSLWISVHEHYRALASISSKKDGYETQINAFAVDHVIPMPKLRLSV